MLIEEAPKLFQSTPPRGGRLCLWPMEFGDQLLVSIHAPARGATWPLLPAALMSGSPPCFNPRPRAGGDWAK